MRRRLFEGDHKAVQTFESVNAGARVLEAVASSVADQVLITAAVS